MHRVQPPSDRFLQDRSRFTNLCRDWSTFRDICRRRQVKEEKLTRKFCSAMKETTKRTRLESVFPGSDSSPRARRVAQKSKKAHESPIPIRPKRTKPISSTIADATQSRTVTYEAVLKLTPFTRNAFGKISGGYNQGIGLSKSPIPFDQQPFPLQEREREIGKEKKGNSPPREPESGIIDDDRSHNRNWGVRLVQVEEEPDQG